MKEYLIKGGKLFIVTDISAYRDGGTVVIKTTGVDYYLHQDSKKFHSDYPPSNENIVTNNLLIEYLVDRIAAYIKIREEDVVRHKMMLVEIIKSK